MLLIVVPIDNPSFSYSLIKRSFHLLADLNPINCFHWWPVVTSSFWEVFHKPTTSLFVLLLVFQQLRSTLLLRMPSQALLWQKLAFFLHSFLSIIYLLFLRSEGIVMLLSSTHLLALSGPCFYRAYPFNRSVVPFCSSFLSLLNQSAFNFIHLQVVQPLKVLWFHSFVKGAT